MKKILSNILLVLIIVVLLFVIYSKYIRKDKIIDFFGYKFMVVLTGSMEPEIETGSFIIVKSEKDYQKRRYCYLSRK
ncbi:MAG: hypothetical protein IJ867_03910 [Clostridia bacterium]|nr:hypothetical protein [Clostridia bacterium]